MSHAVRAIALGLVWLALLPFAVRADPCAVPADAGAERPADGADVPEEVRVGVFLLDVVRVTDRDQSVVVDFNLNLRWDDPRLARGPDSPAICSYREGQIWTPQLRIRNQRQLQRQLKDELRVDRAGRVAYDQRFFGTLRSMGDFSEFPFDERDLLVELIATDRTPDDLVFVWNELRTGKSPTLAVADWDVGSQRFEPRVLELLPGQPFAAVDLVFPMTRRTGYFVWNTIVPLVMIVFMSWCVFFVNPTHLGPQLGLAATSMLSLIAFRFTLADVLPPVSYFTRMDVFLNGASLLVFLALVEAVATSAIADRGNEALAARIDGVSRVAFPAFFALVIGLAFLR